MSSWVHLPEQDRLPVEVGNEAAKGSKLKTGSGDTRSFDQGYFANYEALKELLHRYQVTLTQLAERWPDLKA